MQKLGFKGLKSLERLKSYQVTVPKAAVNLPGSTRLWSDSSTSGSFTGLKIAAEKMLQEQALLNTELDLANSKLKKSLEHIKMLEESLQTAINEYSGLKVKYEELQKHCQGLELKLSSTKSLSDQLAETVNALASQVENVEKDKHLFEEELSANSAIMDNLNDQLNHLSLKLDSADQTLKDRDKELVKLGIEKQQRETFYQDQQVKFAEAMEKKDAMLNSLEENVTACKANIQSLNADLDNARGELRLKEEVIMQMNISFDNLERENTNIRTTNRELTDKLSRSLLEIQSLKDTAKAFSIALIELEKQSLTTEDLVTKLYSMYDKICMLCKDEKMVLIEHAKQKHDQLHQEYLCMNSEKDGLQSENQKLNDRVYELQRVEESLLVQHAEECQLSEEQIRKLESEVNDLTSKKNDNEKLIMELEEKTGNLSECLRSSQDKTKELLLRLSELESESKEKAEELQADGQKKVDEIMVLKAELGKCEEQVDSLEKQISKLGIDLLEKEQLIMQSVEREKCLENQKEEIQALLATAECKFSDAKKQYDLMLENKQLELSKHLKEISQKNDQAVNDIRNKFDLEKQKILSHEKEKAEKAVAEMERNCEQRLDLCRKESELHWTCIHEEQTMLKIKAIRNEQEVQLKALKLQYEDQCRDLQDQLDAQKSKVLVCYEAFLKYHFSSCMVIKQVIKSQEEKQKALLQMQWRVMSDRPQEQANQEVDSDKEYSDSSVRMRDPVIRKRNIHASVRSKADPKDSPYPAEPSPMTTLLRKVEKENSGIVDGSNHRKKVTRREYEVETNNAGKITKRRKTRTVMFGDPRRHKKTTPKNMPRQTNKGNTGIFHTQQASIGDLFTEGSLNPYVDDPYAFD